MSPPVDDIVDSLQLPPSPKDHELLARWRGGDTGAGEVLFQRYYELVERFFLSKVEVAHVADLVQETFIACIEGRDRLSHDQKFRSYLFAVAYNVLCRHLRQRYQADQEVDIEHISIYELTRSPSSVLALQRQKKLLFEALRAIPLMYQVVLELHYWEHLSTAEIAEVLRLPAATIRSRLQRARAALQEAMSQLASSREVLESTLGNLDEWIAQCAREIAGHTSRSAR